MTDKKFYTHQKDLEALKDKLAKEAVCCDHCDINLPLNFRQKKDWIEGREIKRRPLCNPCAKRDHELLTAVLECIRLYGGMVSFLEIIDLYDDEENAKELFFDPFARVRMKYTDDNGLKLKDLEAWVDEEILESNDDQKISLRTSHFREELEKKDLANLNDKQFKSSQRKISSDNQSSTSRIRQQGGASIGKHRWQELRKK